MASVINGTNQGDTLFGTDEADIISGIAGDETLNASFGIDFENGGTAESVLSSASETALTTSIDPASDIAVVQRGIVGKGVGADSYILSPQLIVPYADITITDTGNNGLHLLEGLQIASGMVAQTALLLKLDNGATITVLDADKYDYTVGGDPLTNQAGENYSFEELTSEVLGVSVPLSGITEVGSITIGAGLHSTPVGDLTSATDTIVVQRGIVGKGAGEDTYVLAQNWLTSAPEVTITDTGENTIQFIDGLEVSSSMVASNAIMLTLASGGSVTVLDASDYTYVVGGNPLFSDVGTPLSFTSFAEQILGVERPLGSKISNGEGVTISESLLTEDTSSPSFTPLSAEYNFENYQAVSSPLPMYRSFSVMGEDPNFGDFPGAEIRDVGDINKDGIDDIVIEYFENASAPLIMLGTPDGRFERLIYDIGDVTRRHIRNGELADVDGDGWLDFVGFTTGDAGWRWELAGWTTNGVDIPQGEADLLLINQGGKGFIAIPIPQVSENDYNHGGTVVDLDSDGDLDIATVREGSDEWTAPIINNGNLLFTMSETEYSSEVSYYGTSEVEAGDINDDGYSDLVFTIQESYDPSIENANQIGTVLVIMGDGNFDFSDNYSFKFGDTWMTPSDREIILSTFEGEAVPNSPWVDTNELGVGSGALKLFDLDNDGDLDLFEGQYYTVKGFWRGAGFKYYENVGTSTISLENGEELEKPIFSDKTDIVFPNQDVNRWLIEDEAPGFILDFWFGDINDDGLVDLVLQNENANGDDLFHIFPYIFLNDGDGSFSPNAKNMWPSTDNLAHLVVGNFDSDVGLELVGIRENYGLDTIELITFV